ncbi:MAG: hypothetical protein U0930_04830 [Pirellulales bacterium]
MEFAIAVIPRFATIFFFVFALFTPLVKALFSVLLSFPTSLLHAIQHTASLKLNQDDANEDHHHREEVFVHGLEKEHLQQRSHGFDLGNASSRCANRLGNNADHFGRSLNWTGRQVELAGLRG